MITHWNCEICGKRRADKFISVISYKLLATGKVTRNLKYCNDKPKCIEKAREKAKIREI